MWPTLSRRLRRQLANFSKFEAGLSFTMAPLETPNGVRMAGLRVKLKPHNDSEPDEALHLCDMDTFRRDRVSAPPFLRSGMSCTCLTMTQFALCTKFFLLKLPS
jgi:hypothetical protein